MPYLAFPRTRRPPVVPPYAAWAAYLYPLAGPSSCRRQPPGAEGLDGSSRCADEFGDSCSDLLVAIPVKDRVLRLQRLFALTGRLLEAGVLATAVTALLFLSVTLFLQVFFRYVLERSLPWSEEGARFVLVWFGMVSAVFAARRGLHFTFRWATLRAPRGVQRWLRQVVNILTIPLLCLIFFESLVYLDLLANQRAPGTLVNMRVPFAGVTAGVAALVVVYALEVLDALCGAITGQRFSEREREEDSMYAQLSGE